MGQITNFYNKGSKPRIFLAIPDSDSKRDDSMFRIGIVSLTSESKKPCRVAKKDSTRLYVSLSYSNILELELFTQLASPKIENQACLESHRVVLSCLGSQKN